MDLVIGIAVVAAAAVAVVARSAIRVVPEGHGAAVVRAGRAVRTSGSGLVMVVPGLEQLAVSPLRPPPLEPVSTTASTADGAEVHAVGSVLWEVVDIPRTLNALPDPATVVAEAVERALHHLVGGSELAGLLRDRHDAVAGLPRALDSALESVGVRVVDVDLLDLDVRVGRELLRLLEMPAQPTQRNG